MNCGKTHRRILIFAVMLLAFAAGCPNNLVDTIEEEVEIVVTPPSIVSMYPDNGDVSIPVDIDNILLSFTKNIESSSVNGSSFTVKNADNENVPGSFSVSNDTIAFNPSSALAYGTTFTVTATSGILDVDGNRLVDIFSWSFSTEAAPASIKPVIKYVRLNGGQSATNDTTVTLDISATDSDSYTAGLRFRYRADGSAVWQDWTDLTDGLATVADLDISGLQNGEAAAFVVEVQDSDGVVSDPVDASIIYDLTPPAVIDVNWDNEDTYPYNGTTLTITFDDEMEAASFNSGNYYAERISDSSLIPGVISLIEANDKPGSAANLWGLLLEPNTQYKVVLGNDVKDISGNELGGDETAWYFYTGDSTDSTAPSGTISLTALATADGDPVNTIVTTLPTGAVATNDYRIRLDLSGITDDYNTVWGMKFWGDSDGSEEAFESNAAWESFPAGSSPVRNWNVSTTAGSKFILYKFVDSAGNESPSAGQIKVFLDGEAPANPTVTIIEGAYLNDTSRKINLEFTSSDTHTGVKEMRVSDGITDTGWIPWVPSFEEWLLPDTDASYTLSIWVKDYLDNPAASPGTDSIILDRLDPVVAFADDDILVNSEFQMLEGSTGSDYYEISEANGIAAYSWEYISGPGSLYFNLISGSTTQNNGTAVREPWVYATNEGTYYLTVTATDYAGNSNTDLVSVTLDQNPPDSIANFTVAQSNPGYSTDSQPLWSWDEVSGADFYRVSFDNFSTYVDITLNEYSPNTALADGAHSLYLRAYDYAGNYSDTAPVGVTIDTVAPVISVSNYSYTANNAAPVVTLDFDSGPDGSVTDTGGSGIASYAWSGAAAVVFAPDNASITDVSASSDGTYSLILTVTDNAGNQSAANLTLYRDITLPGTPLVSGSDLTPNLRPTWYWASGGGGIGTYSYRLYNVTDGAVVTAYDWTEVSVLSFTPTADDPLTDQKLYRLDVKEIDAADNWSVAGTFETEVDSTQTTPAQISIGDAYPALRTVSSMTWNVLSGSGGIASNYRYYYDGSGNWSYGGTGLSASTPVSFILPDTSDGDHSLTIQEYFNDAWQTAKTAVHTISIDTTAPGTPTLNGEGNSTINSDRTATNDNYPTWSWSSGGGGNGVFRYRRDGGSWYSGTVTSYTPNLADNTYLLEVQERDEAGNWSATASHRITVDTVAPVLNSVFVRDPSNFALDTDNSHTNNTTVYVDIAGNISAESYPVTLRYLDYNPASAYETYGSPFETDGSMTIATELKYDNGDGTKYVYAQLVDEAGNGSSYKNDSIILDTTAPTGTYSVNNGATYTPSLSYKMNLNVSDNLTAVTNLQVSTYDYYSTDTGTWSDYRPYTALMDSDFQFSVSPGTKYTYVTVYDEAGNYAYLSDSIYLQVPVPQYADKGYYSSGYSRVYYSPVTEDSGANTTRYYTYSTTVPTADPNDGDAVTYEGYTTSTSYHLVSIPKGEIRYFFTRAYNADTGGYGPYSATNVMGFSSSITVVYDSNESKDILIAQYIKELLEDTYWTGGILSQTNMAGTMPAYTATLLPENLINNTAYSTANIIYGDPVIVTPGSTFTYADTSYDYKVRNIAANGRGLIAMGYNGGSMLDRIEINWSGWGLSGTAPTQIGRGESAGIGSNTSIKTRAASTSESIWYSPMRNTYLETYFYNSDVNLSNIFNTTTGDVYRYGVYLTDPGSVVDGVVYSGDNNYSTYFPTVRQGRFLQFGYYDVPGRGFTGATTYQYGQVYFINLVARMDDF